MTVVIPYSTPLKESPVALPCFTVDEAPVLVEAIEHQRMSGPPDAEGFIGRTPVDPEQLPS
jgi:hypothetical protein